LQASDRSHWSDLADAPARKARASDKASYWFFRSRFALVLKLVLPILLLMALFVVPLAYLFRVSFMEVDVGRLVPAVTLDNYAYFLSRPVYQNSLWETMRLGFIVSVACLILGYPLALILAQVKIRYSAILAFILISPLFVSVVIRTFGWLVLLEYEGLVNATLRRLGVIDEPLALLNNVIGVSLGLINVFLVFMVIPIFAALSGIPRSLNEAAQVLGANRIKAWWYVVWPLSAPGVLAGFLLVFALTISQYVQPRLLGGAAFPAVPIHIFRQVMSVLNWPLGAAMGFTLLIVSLGVSFLVYRFIRLAFPYLRTTVGRRR
jgi:putative spermidine/putrescine transport system permease protein